MKGSHVAAAITMDLLQFVRDQRPTVETLLD